MPAWFRREGQQVIVSPETALRLPADPACAVLINATDESAAVVAAAVATLGLEAR